MKVLITGATGLVGGELLKLCKQQNITVHYLTTRKEKLENEALYRGFYWNPATSEIDANCFEGVTAVINLAGASISKRWTAEYKKTIRESRINTLQTLHRAMSEIDVSEITSFVSASAIGIYPTSLTEYYDEDFPGVDDSFLGEVVADWEKAVDAFSGFDFPVAKVRIGLVMSDKGGALPEMAKPVKYYAGAAFGSGNQWQSWIHIRDLARLFMYVVENGLSGVYNGVGPNPVTNTKLVKEIAKVLEKPLLLPNIPEFAMKTLLGEMSYILFASQRVSSKKIEEEGFVYHHQNICKTLEHLYLSSGEQDTDDVLYQNGYV
ncbi:TIGR01777 family oxidoreductase [Maribacter sp. 2-571]|uniref:TIGR01777 family oxidoreductase n=1 Tax=Maribacter sp. 2-571 TaxID=3417569 RepID=UPI003D33C8AA